MATQTRKSTGFRIRPSHSTDLLEWQGNRAQPSFMYKGEVADECETYPLADMPAG